MYPNTSRTVFIKVFSKFYNTSMRWGQINEKITPGKDIFNTVCKISWTYHFEMTFLTMGRREGVNNQKLNQNENGSLIVYIHD